MSNNLKKLIDLLQSDTKLIGQFMSDPESVLENAGLSHDEKKAILSRDVNALIMPSQKSRDFSHGMDRFTQRPFGCFLFWSALYF